MKTTHAGDRPGKTGDFPVSFANFLIAGLDNGGIDVSCRLCEGFVASGGCTCCDDNEVTVEDALAACRAHRCERSADCTTTSP